MIHAFEPASGKLLMTLPLTGLKSEPTIFHHTLYALFVNATFKAIDLESCRVLWTTALPLEFLKAGDSGGWHNLTCRAIGDRVVLHEESGCLSCLEGRTGRICWQSLSGNYSWRYEVDDHRAYVVDNREGHLEALNLQNGAREWESPAKCALDEPVTSLGRLLLFRGEDGGLQAADNENGRILWASGKEVPSGSMFCLRPLLEKDRIIMTSGTRHF